MIVKAQRPIDFINECNCLVDYKELERAILWYQTKPTAPKKKIYMHGRYPAVSIHNEKIHVHRLLMMFWEESKLQREMVVHHINGNKMDSRKENLSLISDTDHARGHHKGKELTESHKQKIGMANRQRKGMKMKKRYDIPTKEISEKLSNGWSINKIAEFYKVDWTTIKNRIYENPELLK